MRDSRLVDAYIDALRRDPHAAPPPGLDPALAEIARQVVQAEHRDPPDGATLDRMWLRAQTLARDTARPRPSTNGHESDNHRQGLRHKEYRDMTVITQTRTRGALPQMGRLLALATVLVVIMWGSFMLTRLPGHETSSSPAALRYEPEDANKEIFLRFIKDVWEQGNTDLLDSLLTPDFVRHEAGMPDMGADALPAFIDAFRAAIPDGVNDIHFIGAEGDRVWVQGTFSGTFSGPLALGPGLIAAPTGETVSFAVMTSARFADGKIAEQWVTTDSLTFMAQLGAVNTPDVRLVEQQNIAVVESLIEEGLNQQDLDAYERYYIEGLSTTHIGNRPASPSDSAGGRQQFIDEYVLHSWPDLEMTIQHIAAQGDYVMVSCLARGTFTYGFVKWDSSVMVATGEVEDWSWVFIYRLEDGKIAEEWWFFDFPWEDSN